MQTIDYQARQKRALELLGNDALLVFAQPEALRNANSEHAYRQDSLMYYLTGFNEPSAALLLLGNGKAGARSIVFLREKDKDAEIWTGRRLGIAAAPKTLHVDSAFAIGELTKVMADVLGDTPALHCRLGYSSVQDTLVIEALSQHRRKRGRHAKGLIAIKDSAVLSGMLRMRKDSSEIDRMDAAAAITAQAFANVYAAVKPGMNERTVLGILLGTFLQEGAERDAYGPIVAGGSNACILHYRSNDAPLNDGELLLIDAAAEFDYYATDVTRTFPIGTSFSAAQKDLYRIVLDAQLAAIELAKPGSTLVAVHDRAVAVLVEGLLALGLLKGSKDEITEKQLFKSFYPHGTSHWLGMDVHDVGDYMVDGKPVTFEPGMVFTIEPGLYIDYDRMDVPKEFRGIGIRVEDDILITDRGHRILTRAIKKNISDLENR